MTQAEQKNSNTERKSLALIVAVTRRLPVLVGRKFTPKTEYKPLQYKSLQYKQRNSRPCTGETCAMAINLIAYEYDVEYTPRQDIGNADALPRVLLENDENHLVAVAIASFAKSEIDVEKLRKKVNRINSRNG